MTFLGYAACPECGVAIPLGEVAGHECNHEQWIAYQIAKARREMQRFEAEFERYLESAHGRFDAWYAERTRQAA